MRIGAACPVEQGQLATTLLPWYSQQRCSLMLTTNRLGGPLRLGAVHAGAGISSVMPTDTRLGLVNWLVRAIWAAVVLYF